MLADTGRELDHDSKVELSDDQVRALQGDVAVSDLIHNPDTGNWFVRLSEPVRRDGKVSGVLSISLSATLLSRLLIQAQLPSEWTLAIVDRNGVIIARSKDQERFVGTTATEDLRRNTTGTEGSWFEDYNENHPHSGLKMRSPREFIRAQTQ